MLFIYYPTKVMYSFLLEIEGRSQPKYMELVIPLLYPYFAGKIGFYIENNFALE
jgi:hypothetical protein